MLFMASAAVVGVGTSASAAPAGCKLGYTCLWEDTGYQTNGSRYNVAAFEYYHTNFRYWGAWQGINHVNDKASSVYNNGRTHTSFLFVHSKFTGPGFSLKRGTGDSDLHNAAGAVRDRTFADELSSGCFENDCYR